MHPWLRIRPAAVLVPALLVSLAASFVLFLALEESRSAERARQEKFMRTAATAVVDDLGSELFVLYSAFGYDLWSLQGSSRIIDQQVVSSAYARYRARARFPDLLKDLVCLSVGKDGRDIYTVWNGTGWIEDLQPSWAEDLQPPLRRANTNDPPEPRVQSAFSMERPVLTVYFRGRKEPGCVVGLALRFNTQVVVGQIVPTLVKERFAESATAQNYRAAVRNRARADQTASSTADWSLALLPWTPFQSWFDYYTARLHVEDRQTYPGVPTLATAGSDWVLEVQRLPRGIEDEMQVWLWSNLGTAFGFFGVLVLGIGGLYGIARQALIRAQQEKTFMALVSHELKTPLAVIRSLSDNLAQGIGTDPSRAQRYGEVLGEEAARLERMIGNVLGLTAIRGGVGRGERSPVDLGVLVKERVARQADVGPDTQVEVLVHPGLPLVWGHPAALAAAIDNLVGNAFRHGTAGPGPHRVRFRVDPARRRGRAGVEFLVEDDGPGFSTAEGRSFRHPFRRGEAAHQSQTPGGGVGLSLVHSTAAALGGSLRWRSSPGRGAQFRLWLEEARG